MSDQPKYLIVFAENKKIRKWASVMINIRVQA